MRSFCRLCRGNLHGLGQARQHIPAPDIQNLIAGANKSRTDTHFDFFSRTLTNHDVEILLYISSNVFIKLIAGNAQGFAGNDTAQRNHRNIRSTATDIHHHGATRLNDIETCAQSCCQRFFNQLRMAGTCLLGSFLYSPLFHHRAARRNTNHNPRTEHKTAAHNLFNEMAQHALRNIIICNNTFAQRTNSYNITRRTANHLPCLFTDSQHPVRIPVNGHHRRLTQNNALAFHIYQHICSAQVNTNIQ